MNDTLAKIHLVDWKALGLADFGKPGNYMARQVSRWHRQYEASKTDDIEDMDYLFEWLDENIPSDDSATVVHGDLRLENMIIHPFEPRVMAVLDWELSTLGHPLSDLAYNCIQYYIPVSESRLSGYKGLNLSELGIPLGKPIMLMPIAAAPAGAVSPIGNSSWPSVCFAWPVSFKGYTSGDWTVSPVPTKQNYMVNTSHF